MAPATPPGDALATLAASVAAPGGEEVVERKERRKSLLQRVIGGGGGGGGEGRRRSSVAKGRKSLLQARQPEAAAELPEMFDNGPGDAANCVSVVVLRGRDFRVMDHNLFSKGGSSDPFVTATIEGRTAKTSIKKKTTAPEWHERLDLSCEHLEGMLILKVYDWDQLSSPDFMGTVAVKLEDLGEREQCRGWFPLLNEDLRAPDEPRGDLEIACLFHHDPKRVVAVPEAFFAAEEHAKKAANALRVVVVRATNLPAMDASLIGRGGSSDPFVEVALGGEKRRTPHISKDLNPVWLAEFDVPAEDVADGFLELRCFDYDLASGDDLIGSVNVPLEALHANRTPVRAWYELDLATRRPKSPGKRGTLLGRLSSTPPASPTKAAKTSKRKSRIAAARKKSSENLAETPPPPEDEPPPTAAAPSKSRLEVALRMVHNPDYVLHLEKGLLDVKSSDAEVDVDAELAKLKDLDMDVGVELDADEPADDVACGKAVLDPVAGPYSPGDLRDAYETGRLGPDALVWRAPMPGEDEAAEDLFGPLVSVKALPTWGRRQACEGCRLVQCDVLAQCELCGGLATLHSVDALALQLAEGDRAADDVGEEPRPPKPALQPRAGSTIDAKEVVDGLVWVGGRRAAEETQLADAAHRPMRKFSGLRISVEKNSRRRPSNSVASFSSSP